MRPCGAGVAGFVNTVAGRQVGSNIRLASSGVDRLGVSWCHRDCSDRAHRLVVEDGPPDSSGVRGFPDSAIDRAEIKSSRVTRHSCDGNYSTSTEWANESPFEATHQLRRNGLGKCGGRNEKKEERAETLVEIRPTFVQVAIPRWVASLLENAKLLVGHKCMRLGESANPFCTDHGLAVKWLR